MATNCTQRYKMVLLGFVPCSLSIIGSLVKSAIRQYLYENQSKTFINELQTDVDNRNIASMFQSKFCKIEKGPSCFIMSAIIHLSKVTAYVITFYSWDQTHAYTAIQTRVSVLSKGSAVNVHSPSWYIVECLTSLLSLTLSPLQSSVSQSHISQTVSL
jgi:hypothetical protein